MALLTSYKISFQVLEHRVFEIFTTKFFCLIKNLREIMLEYIKTSVYYNIHNPYNYNINMLIRLFASVYIIFIRLRNFLQARLPFQGL